MTIPLVVHNLLEQKVRTLIAVLGIGFSILLIFMQWGFYDSARQTATVLLDRLDFDVVLLSPDYLEINRAGSFPRSRLFQVEAVPGAERVTPLYVASQTWRIKTGEPARPRVPIAAQQEGFQRGIMVVGFDPNAEVFLPGVLTPELRQALRRPGNVLMDSATRDFFGRRGVGVRTELGYTTVEIAGLFRIGTGYGADGMVLVSDLTYGEVYSQRALDRVSLGLVKLRPGADPGRAAAALRQLLGPGDVRVRTRAEMLAAERSFWIWKTSLGIIFGIGLAVAVVVGVVFVFQVLSTDIGNRFAEYATLKAMGYTNGYLSGLVLQQAAIYAAVGYVPGLLVAWLLYWLGGRLKNLPLEMDWWKMFWVLVLALAMASVSALLAIRKVRKADPAELF